jgi:hypothetical protein
MRTTWKLQITIEMKSKLLANITPGEILDEEFLKPMPDLRIALIGLRYVG